MPAAFAATAKLVEMMGFYMWPHQPFWWHDTALDEIVQYIGRAVYCEAAMAYPYGYGKTRGLREVSFWATFFDLMRPMRSTIAQAIIHSADNLDSNGRKTQLLQSFTAITAHFEQRNATLRDPLQARMFEMQQAYDAPADERYQRIKAAAMNLLAQSQGLQLNENAPPQAIAAPTAPTPATAEGNGSEKPLAPMEEPTEAPKSMDVAPNGEGLTA